MSTKSLITSLLIITFHCLNAQVSNKIYDKSFEGKWKLEIDSGDSIYVKCKAIPSNENGFELSLNDKTFKQKVNNDHSISIYDASWWSIAMGNFGIEYIDTILNKEVVERFIYKDKNHITRVLHEEYSIEINTDFLGCWVLADTSKEITYTKVLCDEAPDNKRMISLFENGTGLIQLFETDKKQTLEAFWWLNDEGTYIDVQYSYPNSGFVIIEGFELDSTTNPIQLKRIRYEKSEN
ncbi:MAG: hypothetical protein ABI207_00600 [Crocinitomicaceae bacterium]